MQPTTYTSSKEQCLDLHRFRSLEEARQVIAAFVARYSHEWLIERLGYRTAAQARAEGGGPRRDDSADPRRPEVRSVSRSATFRPLLRVPSLRSRRGPNDSAALTGGGGREMRPEPDRQAQRAEDEDLNR